MTESNKHSHTVFVVSGLVALLGMFIIISAYNLNSVFLNHATELEKCPQCLGYNMCNCFISNKFKLNWDHFWTNLLNIFIVKRILFGSCDGQVVVLKWVKQRPRDLLLSDFNPDIESMASLMQFGQSNLSGEKFVLCPSVKKLDHLLKPIVNEESSFSYRNEKYQHLLYSLQVNMAPVIQQITSDWAVARYLGACGDISVSEYCGHTLTSVFSQLSWGKRSSITKQILQFALNATFDNPSFAFYFTDLSPDNFAVSEEGEIRLVDLDNVIVVDKYPSDVLEDWNIVHTSYHDKDVKGFAFSTEEICSHKISDTNVYGICQGILSADSDLLPGGLLHSPPPHLRGLKKLVEDCISPPFGQSRFDIAQSIINTLKENVDT